MKYTVNLCVTARMCVDVDADSPEEAIQKANGIMSDADCGPLSDIDWETHSVEDEAGNPVSTEEVQPVSRTIRDKFESLLETRHDSIDNAAYHLAVAIVRNDPKVSVAEAARELLQELAFQIEVHIDHPAVALISKKARSILIAKKFYDGSDTPVASNIPDENVLEWNARYIGKINTVAEALLAKSGVPTCYPYYDSSDDDDNCYIMCIYCNDCHNACALKSDPDYPNGNIPEDDES